MLLGIILNPRSLMPVFVFGQRGRSTIEIVSGDDLAKEGDGYFDSGGDASYSSSEATGYPRVHTPSGVHRRGEGFGTCLYGGLALAAYMESEHSAPVRVNTSGPGISSNENRSSSADEWWLGAVNKGIAFSKYVEAQAHFDEDVTEYADSSSVASMIGAEEVDDFSLHASGYRVEEVEADVLPYHATTGRYRARGVHDSLVVVECMGYDMSPSDIVVADFLDSVVDINKDAFRLLNLAGLPQETIELVTALARSRRDLGKPFEDVLVASAFNLSLDELPDDVGSLAGVVDIGLDDFIRANPSLTRKDRLALQRRAEIGERLGIEDYALLGD